MNKYLYCLKCDKEQNIEVRLEEESYPVRGEGTTIMAKVSYCKHCNEQIWNEELDENNLIELASYPDVFELLLNKNKEYVSDWVFDRAMKKLANYRPLLSCKDNLVPYRSSPNDNQDNDNK